MRELRCLELCPLPRHQRRVAVVRRRDVAAEAVALLERDEQVREREAVGFVSGTYTATTKYDFTRVRVPVDGRYKIRMKTYTFLAGPNGASGGDDHGLTGGRKAWWRPSRTVAFPGTRSEPITLYSVSRNGDSRWLAVYDSHPEPSVSECELSLIHI
mgnify:CR=1 FL=1